MVAWHRALRRSPRVEAAVIEALAEDDLTAGALVDACSMHNEQEVLDVVAELSESGRVQPRPGRRGALLLHLVQHQIHHRGQSHVQLQHAGIDPPQLDDFYLEYGRVPSAQAYWS